MNYLMIKFIIDKLKSIKNHFNNNSKKNLIFLDNE